MNRIVGEIQRLLADSADERNIAISDRFYKEGEKAKVRGVKFVEVGKIAGATLPEIRKLPKAEVFAMCEQLWKSGYLEDAIVACAWSKSQHKRYTPEDMDVFERWLDLYVSSWGDCDTLCNHTVGALLMTYPEFLSRLRDEWTGRPNRWMRRGAAVSLIVPARRGLFLSEIFQIADRLLSDPDDLVRKGYGWMLKVASEKHRDEVFDWVMSRRTTMPRTALRYAIEKMPPEMRAEAMKKQSSL